LHGRRNDLLGLEATYRRLRSALVELGEGDDADRVTDTTNAQESLRRGSRLTDGRSGMTMIEPRPKGFLKLMLVGSTPVFLSRSFHLISPDWHQKEI
jgi:hypothetical protein